MLEGLLAGKENTGGKFRSVLVQKDWPENSKAFGWTTYSFIVYDGQIIGFTAISPFITGDHTHETGFWDKTLTKHYDFPLKDRDLEEMFGKPDDITVLWCH